MRRVKVDGHPNLARDMNSGGIVNTSAHEYNQFMTVYRKKQADKQKMESVCDELNSLKDEMTEIKELMKKILEK